MAAALVADGAEVNASHAFLGAEELRERGFDEGEELLLAYVESDSEEEREEQRRIAAVREREAAAAAAAPSGAEAFSDEQVHEILYGDPAHCHSDRQLAERLGFFAAMLEIDDGEFSMPVERRLKCFDYEKLTDDAFERLVDTPCVLDGVAQAEGWPAADRWSTEHAFCKENSDVVVPITELFPLHGLGKPRRLGVPLRHYAEYARTNDVDFPYYPWEREFEGERAAWLATFWQPRLFKNDAFDLSQEARTWFPFSTHRFVILGGRRCGASVHQDPKASGAWNHLLFGRKRWCFFPPTVPKETLWGSAGAAESYREVPSSYWWLDHYPRLRNRASELGMLEVLQEPGDTLYVPPGWWHAVLNLPDSAHDEALTLCVTQNAVTPTMLRGCPYCWRTLSTYPFAADLAALIREAWPDLDAIVSAPVAPATAPEPIAEGRAEVEETNLSQEALELLEARRAVFMQRGKPGRETWREIPRVAASALSLHDCRSLYIRRGRPVVITGMGEALLRNPGCPWEFLKDRFGGKRVCTYGQSLESRSQNVLGEPALCLLAEQLDAARTPSSSSRAGSDRYLYDVSVPQQLPELLEWWRLPQYFAHDYLQQTMRQHVYRGSWPTLFVGAAGTASTLHVDRWHGHFWMLQVAGRKRWRMWAPEDTALLRPRWEGHRLDPRFPPIDELLGDDQVMQRCVTIVLNPGDVLFVPGGAPHVVENLEASIALAGNFVDDSNVDAVMADLAALAAGDPEDATALQALEEIDFEPERGMHAQRLSTADDFGVRYEDFASGSAALWRPEV